MFSTNYFEQFTQMKTDRIDSDLVLTQVMQTQIPDATLCISIDHTMGMENVFQGKKILFSNHSQTLTSQWPTWYLNEQQLLGD